MEDVTIDSVLNPGRRQAAEARLKTEDFFRDNLEKITFGGHNAKLDAESRLNEYAETFGHCSDLVNRMITVVKAKHQHYWTILNIMIFQMGAISIEEYEEAAILKKEIDEKEKKYALEFLSLSGT